MSLELNQILLRHARRGSIYYKLGMFSERLLTGILRSDLTLSTLLLEIF